MSVLRIATYNVHKCKGVDWRVAPHRIAGVISDLKADLVAVQEVLLSQAEVISKRACLPFTFGEARRHCGEPYGNAVFARFPIQSSESYDITVRRREPRQCLHLSIALTPRFCFHFFALHLGTSFLERREQARLLLSNEMLGKIPAPRLVAGDFNEWTRGLATHMFSERMHNADISLHLKRRASYPGVLPFLHLDHIYYDRQFFLREMHLHRSRLALLASDHLPLLADFEIHGSPPSLDGGSSSLILSAERSPGVGKLPPTA